MNTAQVPLADGERVVRGEGELARGTDPLDPRDAAHRPERVRILRTHLEREGVDAGDARSRDCLNALRHGPRARALLDPDRKPGGVRRCRSAHRGEDEERKDEASHAGPTLSVGLIPGTNP